MKYDVRTFKHLLLNGLNRCARYFNKAFICTWHSIHTSIWPNNPFMYMWRTPDGRVVDVLAFWCGRLGATPSWSI